ncbi:hypothetical protein FA10DRAFT_301265 [Acaromyces ingoldii]|uniref:Uncharacterized protein n=1 Tax=Acaromyces ingoldii TaxID=215250 RepID=A0A316YL88_9BASI|nr:hypothetical protein FA10DRAFT_301265 [Acaromyces ingoldii]PWN89972.1 hypothetical protein FA10DRAFT_301265 [Acaromyces ingoldii]
MPSAFGRRSSNAQSTLSQVPTSSSLSSGASTIPLPPQLGSGAYSSEGLSPSVSPSIGTGGSNPFEQQHGKQNHHHAPSTASSSTFASTFAGGASLTASTSGSAADAQLRETMMRRIRTLAYLKRIFAVDAGHPPQTWLDTVRLTRRDLDGLYEPSRTAKRTSKYFTLGCSLAPVLELSQGQDLVRGIIAVINDVEAASEGEHKDKTKMKNFFKNSISRGSKRGNTMGSLAPDLASSFEGGASGIGPGGTMAGDLIGASVPFQLDFCQTMMSLCDILSEVYYRFLYYLGPAPPSSAFSAMSASAVSFNSDASTSPAVTMMGSDPVSTPTAGMADLITKADSKLKKYIGQVTKELDGLARQVIRDEMSALDTVMAREPSGPGLTSPPRD